MYISILTSASVAALLITVDRRFTGVPANDPVNLVDLTDLRLSDVIVIVLNEIR